MLSKIRKRLSKREGIALIIALLVVALLVTVIVEFNRIAVADIDISKNFGDEKKILFIMISGVNALKELLRLDGLYSKGDTLLEAWAKSSQYFASTGSILEEGRFEGDVVDEDGKINVNSLVNEEGKFDETHRAIWERLLTQPRFGLTEEEVNTIICGVKDWIDADDEITGIYGAEDSFYLRKGYHSKNSKIDTLEEMLQINGVTKDIFYGNQYKNGIRDYFTVYGGQSININTAPIPVLMALSEDMTEEIAGEMDLFRRDETNRMLLINKLWYRKVWPFENRLPEHLITTSSNHFTVYMRGTLRESRKEIKAVLLRSDADIGLVYWQEM